ncbi:uncharacterized protein KY384_008000 [Bacidia gigantensis]|uniref:uncharacterized protein n=1 Tax=Bacidia gigantensis TaxID=2732470 RepID=UPI001D04972B|nr:uncharacterized protein KY384_008000 [Bacidia gigantensis]KAG8527256.1 hypothetical protein KY384_008000 [Bacidia gigantensis]
MNHSLTSSPPARPPSSSNLAPYVSDTINSWIASASSHGSCLTKASSAPPTEASACLDTAHFPTLKRRRSIQEPPPSPPQHISHSPPSTPSTMADLQPPSDNTPSTPQTSQSAKKQKTSHTQSQFQHQLDNFGFLLNDGAIQEYPNFWAHIKQIVVPVRTSATKMPEHSKQKEQARFNAAIEDTRAYEDTFLETVLPMLAKATFEASPQTKTQIEQREKEKAGKRQDPTLSFNLADENEWQRHGLMKATKTPYIKNQVKTKIQAVLTVLKDYKGDAWALTDPVLDRTLGFHVKYFDYTKPKRLFPPSEVFILFEVCPLLHHPFCIFEGKGSGGDLTELTMQGLRDGATLVTVHRELRHRFAGMNDNESRNRDPNNSGSFPDWSTFVFTFTLSAGCFEVYVNWAEVMQDGSIVDHMNLIKSVSLRDDESRELGSRWLHNVIEWGLFTRRQELLLMRHNIYNKELKKQKQPILTNDEAQQLGLPVIEG